MNNVATALAKQQRTRFSFIKFKALCYTTRRELDGVVATKRSRVGFSPTALPSARSSSSRACMRMCLSLSSIIRYKGLDAMLLSGNCRCRFQARSHDCKFGGGQLQCLGGRHISSTIILL